MARPKDTKTTKWLIHRESWHESRKDAVQRGKQSKLPYEAVNLPSAKTMWGIYRTSTWRLRTFTPKLYRGRRPVTGTWTTKAAALRAKKYHPNKILAQIRGGAWLYLEQEKFTPKPKKKKSARARKR